MLRRKLFLLYDRALGYIPIASLVMLYAAIYVFEEIV